MEQDSLWVKKANAILYKLYDAKTAGARLFAREEQEGHSDWKGNVSSRMTRALLDFDCGQMVPLKEVEYIVKCADIDSIDNNIITYNELIDVYEQARQLQRDISFYNGQTTHAPEAAQRLFKKMVAAGVFIQEITPTRRVLASAHSAQGLELEAGRRLEAIFEQPHDAMMDELADADGLDGFDLQNLNAEVDRFLVTSELRSQDLPRLESLWSRSLPIQGGVHNFGKLNDVKRGFDWLKDLATRFDCQAASLQTMADRVSARLPYFSPEEVALYENWLAGCLDITYSLAPVTAPLQSAKALFWDSDARKALNEPTLNKDKLRKLLKKIPAWLTDVPAHFAIVQELLRRAESIDQRINDLKVTIEALARHEPDLSRPEAKSAATELENLKYALGKDPQLKRFKEFEPLKEQLANLESVYSIFRLVCKLKTAEQSKSDKIGLPEFIELYEISRQEKLKDFVDSNLFISFKEFYDTIIDSKTFLENFQDKITKEVSKPPYLFDPPYFEHVKTFVKQEALASHFSKLERYFFLSELGYTIKNFLKKYRATEGQLLELAGAHGPEALRGLPLEEIRRVKEAYLKARQDLHIRVCSEKVEELALFEWSLCAVELLKTPGVKLEKLKKHLTKAAIFARPELPLFDELNDSIEKTEELKKQLEDSLRSGPKRLDELQAMIVNLKKSPVDLQTLRRRINVKISHYLWIADTFECMENRRKSKIPVQMEEILALEAEIKVAQVKIPEIEDKLRLYCDICSLNLQNILNLIENCGLKIDKDIGPLLDEYKEAGFAIREVETLVKKRNEVLQKLGLLKVDHIVNMPLKQLGEIEYMLRDSLDIEKNSALFDIVVYHRLKAALKLLAQSKDWFSPEDIVKKDDYFTLIDKMGYLADNNDIYSFNTTEILSLTTLKDNVAKQILGCKQKFEANESFQMIGKTILKFVDYNADLKKVAEDTAKLRRVMKAPIKPEQPKNSTVNVEIEDEFMLRERLKELRKEARKNFKNLIEESLQPTEPNLAFEYTLDIDEAIHYRVKTKEKEFNHLVLLYKRFIDAFKTRSAVCQVVLQSNYDPRLLEKMINNKKADYFRITDEKAARNFIFQMQIELEVSQHKEQDLIASLGKRARQPTIQEYMNRVFRSNAEAPATPVKRPLGPGDLETRMRSAGNSDQKKTASGRKIEAGRPPATPSGLLNFVGDQIKDIERTIKNDYSEPTKRKKIFVKSEDEEELFDESRASRESNDKPEPMAIENLKDDKPAKRRMKVEPLVKETTSRKRVYDRHIIPPPEDLKVIFIEEAYYAKVDNSSLKHASLQHLDFTYGEVLLHEAFKSPTEKQLSGKNYPLVIKRQVSGLSPAIFDSEMDKTTQEDIQTGISTSGIDSAAQFSDKLMAKNSSQWLNQEIQKNLGPLRDQMGEESDPRASQQGGVQAGGPGVDQCGTEAEHEAGAIPVKVACADRDQPPRSPQATIAAAGDQRAAFDADIVVPAVYRRDPAAGRLPCLGPRLTARDSYADLHFAGGDGGSGVAVGNDDGSLAQRENNKEVKTPRKGKSAGKRKKQGGSKVNSSQKDKNKISETLLYFEEKDDQPEGMKVEFIQETPLGKAKLDIHAQPEGQIDQGPSQKLEEQSATKTIIGKTQQKQVLFEQGLTNHSRSPPQTASRKYGTRATHSSRQPSHLGRAADPGSSAKPGRLLGKRQPLFELTPPQAKATTAFKVLATAAGPGRRPPPAKGAQGRPLSGDHTEARHKPSLERAGLRRPRPKEEVAPPKGYSHLTRTTRKKELLPALLQKKLPVPPKPAKDLNDSIVSGNNRSFKRLKKEEEIDQKQVSLKDKIAPSAKKSTKDKSGSPSGEFNTIQITKIDKNEKEKDVQPQSRMNNELDMNRKSIKEIGGRSSQLFKKDTSNKVNNFVPKAPPSRKKADDKNGATYQLNGSYLPRNMCHAPESASSRTESISDRDQTELNEIQDFEDFKKMKQKLKKEFIQKNKETRKSLRLSKIEYTAREKSSNKKEQVKEEHQMIEEASKFDKRQPIAQQILTRTQKPSTSCWSIYEDVIRFTVLNDREASLKLVALTSPQYIRKAADFGAEKLDINRIFGREEFEELLMALSVKIASNSILKIGGFIFAEEGENILTDLIRCSPGGSGRVFWSTIKESMEIYLIRPKDISPHMRPYFDGVDSEEFRTASFCFLMLQDAELYQEFRRMRPVAFEKDVPECLDETIKSTFRPENEAINERKMMIETPFKKQSLYNPTWRDKESNDLLNFDNQARKGSLNEMDEYQLDTILEKGNSKNRNRYIERKKKNQPYNQEHSNSPEPGDKQSCCSSLVDFKH
jgi:hypothetical protein